MKKALYGLKQSPCAWYEKIHPYLTAHGFFNSPNESILYVKKTSDVFLVIVLYIDDMLLTGLNEDYIANFKAELNSKFEISDLGFLYHYLGIQF